MDHLNRFSDYDVFAYLSSGLAAFAVIDLVFDTTIVVNASWDAAGGTLTILMAYPLGHLIASPASKFLERTIVRRWLGLSTQLQLEGIGVAARPWWRRLLFRDYHTPASPNLRKRALDEAKRHGWKGGDKQFAAVFWFAHPVAQEDPVRYPRMQSFLNLYGFHRNLSFVALLGGVLMFGKAAWMALHAWSADVSNTVILGAGLVFVGFLLFQRYLKFNRLYAHEALVAFVMAAGKEHEPVGDNKE